MILIRTARFVDSFKILQQVDNELFLEVAVDLTYLLSQKRQAVLPQVRFGIAQSKYGVMGEVRSHVRGHPEFVRTLFAMPTDESVCAFLLLGDKNSAQPGSPIGNNWYTNAIPIADEAWRRILQTTFGQDQS